MLKENKGVTLVALVITIIVLLILAGVSISLVVGDNGVLSQATNAADTTNVSSVESALGIAISGAQTNWYAGYYSNPATITDSFAKYLVSGDGGLEDNLSSDYTELKVTNFTSGTSGDSTTGTVKYNGKTFSFTLTLTSNANGATVSDVKEQ